MILHYYGCDMSTIMLDIQHITALTAKKAGSYTLLLALQNRLLFPAKQVVSVAKYEKYEKLQNLQKVRYNGST